MGKKVYLSDLCEQLKDELGAEVIVKGDYFAELLFKHGNWLIKLKYTVELSGATPDYSTTFTAPFVSKDDLRFLITPHIIPEKASNFFGFYDIQINHSVFDRTFKIKGANENKVKELLTSDEIRQLLIQIKEKKFIEVQIKDNEGFWGPKYPENVDVLYYRYFSKEQILDIELIKLIIKLYTLILEELVNIGSITKENPKIY